MATIAEPLSPTETWIASLDKNSSTERSSLQTPTFSSSSLQRRLSAASTSNVSLAAFSEALDDDAVSSIAPFLPQETVDRNPSSAFPGGYRQRRRSSLLRTALTVLRRNSNSNSPTSSHLLFTAALTGDLALLKTYHEAGGDLFATTGGGGNLTALHLAAGAGQPYIVEYLVRNTEAPKPTSYIPLSPSTSRETRPLPPPSSPSAHLQPDATTRQQSSKIPQAADTSAETPPQRPPQKPLPCSPLLITTSKRQDRTCLYLATAANSLPCARLLLSTPSATYLLKHASKYDGATAVHAAARIASVPMLSLLLSYGARINTQDLEGMTALNWAVTARAVGSEKRVEVTDFLIKSGAVVNARTKNGFMVIHSAVTAGDIEVIRAVARHHLSSTSGHTNTRSLASERHPCDCINSEAPFTMRAIHSAVFANRPDILSLLIEAGADVEARVRKGWTPLHIAARFGYRECGRILVAAGADKGARNDKGLTPTEVARSWGNDWNM